MTKQIKDNGGTPINLYSYNPHKCYQIAFNSTSAISPVFSAGIKVLTITATADCFVDFDTVATVTDSHYVKASNPYSITIPAFRQLSVVSNTTGTLYISERS